MMDSADEVASGRLGLGLRIDVVAVTARLDREPAGAGSATPAEHERRDLESVLRHHGTGLRRARLPEADHERLMAADRAGRPAG